MADWHEEARRLRAADPKQWTLQRLADRFGVHASRIWQVCHRDEATFRKRHREYDRAWRARYRARQRAESNP